MNRVWLAVVIVGAATIAIKAVGPVLLGGRELPPRVGNLVALAAPALLAALVVTQAVGGDRKLVFDARLTGLAAGALAVRLRAPLVVVMVVSAAVTAVVRLLT